MLKSKNLLSVCFSFVITIFVVFSSFTSIVKANGTSQLLFSEVNFLGSSYSASDEWIELYNPMEVTQDLTGILLKINTNIEIPLNNYLIDAKGYFLISNFSTNAINSGLNLSEDNLVSSKLSLANPTKNTALTLQLVKSSTGELLDEVIFNQNYNPKNSSNGKYSLYREDFDLLSPNFNNWKQSFNRKNLKKAKVLNNICTIDFGTPGAENFNLDKTQIFEVEDLCFTSGEIISEQNENFLKVNNFKGNLFNFDLELDKKSYSIDFLGKSENSNNTNFSIGSAEVNSGNGKFKLKKINSNRFNSGKAQIIFKNKSKKLSNISFSTDLNSSQIIYLDKIIIKELTSQSRKKVEITNADLPFSEKTFELEDSGINAMKFEKNNFIEGENLIDETYLFDSVNSSAQNPYLTNIKVKATNFDSNITDFSPILTINMENPTSGIIKTRTFYKNDFDENYKDLMFATISEKDGVDIFTAKIYGNADIYINGLVFQEIGRSVTNINYEEIPFIESLDKNLIEKVDANQASFNKEKGKIFEATTSNYCLISAKCNIEINLNLKNLNEKITDQKIAKIFIGTKDSTSTNSQIIEIKKSDFDANGNLKLIINSIGLEKKNKIVIYSYGNAKLALSKPKFSNQNANSNSELISNSNIDWNKSQILKTENANGKLLDLLQTNGKISPQKLSLNYKIKKIEDFTSGKDLMKIRIIDDKGNKLAEKVWDENDLKFNEEKTEKIDFDLKKDGKVFIYIYFFGNQLGAQSDLEFGEIKF